MHTLKTLTAALALLACTPTFASEPVDINTADAVTLAEAIDGVGLKRAESIVEYRDRNGPFRSVDDLVEVRGVGEKILEGNRGNLTVGAPR